MSCPWCDQTPRPRLYSFVPLECVAASDIREGDFVYRVGGTENGMALVKAREPHARRAYACPHCKKERTL